MRDVSREKLRAGVGAALIAAASTLLGPLRAATPNAVVDWNAIAITAVAAAGPNGSQQERSLAITSVAVSDAVNAITNEYTRYGSRLTPPFWGLDDSRRNGRSVSRADAASCRRKRNTWVRG